MSSSALAEGLFLFIIRISFAHTTPKPQKGAKRVEEQNRRSGRGRRVKLAAVYLLAALAAAAVANYLITPGLLCAVLMGLAALVITDGLQILLMTYQQGVAFSAASSLAGREILVTLPLTVLVYLPFRWVRRRIYSE